MTNEVTEDRYAIPGGEDCRICGLRYYNKSMGGPGVCPSCDCGESGPRKVKAQREEIERLREKIKRLEAMLASSEPRQIESITVEPRDERTVSATQPTGGPAFVHGIGATIESPARHITTVGGIESFGMTRGQIDTFVHLARCPFCGSQAGFHDSGRLDTKFNRWVECSNTSCGVRTPEHYQTREAAAEAWNRRDRNAAPEKKAEPKPDHECEPMEMDGDTCLICGSPMNRGAT